MIGSYIHHNGKIGVMVEVNCETDFVARTDDFKQLVQVRSPSTSPRPRRSRSTRIRFRPDKVERERRIFVEQVKESGKPEHLIEKIVEGKIEAYYKDVALVHQAWVREPKKTIGELVKEASAKTRREHPGSPVRSLPDGRGVEPALAELKYQRVLLKLSGEALAGDKGFGLRFRRSGASRRRDLRHREDWAPPSAS